MTEGLTIRGENPGDIPASHTVNEEAFDQPNEADLVDALPGRGIVKFHAEFGRV